MNGTAPSSAPHGGTSGDGSARLEGRWLLLARAGWLLVALVVLGLDVLGTQPYFQQTQTACIGSTCLPHQLQPADLRALVAGGGSLVFFAAYEVALTWIGTLVYAGLATVLFVKRSDDRLAMFGAYTFMLFGAGTVFGPLNALRGIGAPWAAVVSAIVSVGPLAFYVFFCLFPGGRFAPTWMRWVALAWIIGPVVTLIPYAPLRALSFDNLAFFVFFLLLVYAQVYRYREVSTPVQREQTKWVVFGFAAGLGGFIAILVAVSIVPAAGLPSATFGIPVVDTALGMALWLIPIFIAVAILRSRLWDIDLIINRTLVYGSLTAILAAVYLGCVFAFQAMAQALTGERPLPPPVIVASTLLIAALVHPLRRRLQRFIDRRFFRAKYDAAKTVAAFGAALRSEVDLPRLNEHLLSAVEDTMQPAHVSLWLREPADRPGR